MKSPRFSSKVRSQALIEFAFMSILFFSMVLVVLFFAIDIYRAQTMASAVRQGASTSARITRNNIDEGLNSALSVAKSGFKYENFMTNGLIIVTKMQKYTNEFYLSDFTNGGTVGTTGYLAGTNFADNAGMSKLISSNGGDWTALIRKNVPNVLKSTNAVVSGKDLYCVEIFYTNRSPLNILGFSQPALIYDRSFFLAP